MYGEGVYNVVITCAQSNCLYQSNRIYLIPHVYQCEKWDVHTLEQNDEELTFSHVTNSIKNDAITGVCCPTVSKVIVSWNMTWRNKNKLRWQYIISCQLKNY
jgi:hypothetical protein